MRKTLLITIILYLAAGCYNMLQAQEEIVVHSNDETTWKLNLSDLGKIEVTDTGFSFVGTGEQTLSSFLYTDMRKVTLTLTPTAITSPDAASDNMKVYPNPAEDYINILGWELSGKLPSVSIYTATGQLYRKIDQWDGSAISVSGLTPGLYLINIDNHLLKLIKK